MAAAGDAQALVNAQNQIELGKIPIFFGDKSKDAFTAEHWLERIELSRNTAPWTDVQTVNYFYQALRGNAVKWWAFIKDNGVNMTDWTAVAEKFLAAYGTTVTERSAVANLRLQQLSKESCADYAGRVTMAMREHNATAWQRPPVANAQLMDAFFGPATAANVHPVAFFDNAATNANKQRALAFIREQQSKHERDILARNVYISGLRKEIREEILKMNDPKPYMETVEDAMRLERQLSDPHKEHQVTEVEEGEVDAIKRSHKKGQKTSYHSGSGASKPKSYKCFYCGLMGHIQPNCNKRKRENGQWKDKDGKPWQKRVNEVQENQFESQQHHNYESLAQNIATTENALSSIEAQLYGNISSISLDDFSFPKNEF
jgi:Retrotransposon gag protein